MSTALSLASLPMRTRRRETSSPSGVVMSGCRNCTMRCMDERATRQEGEWFAPNGERWDAIDRMHRRVWMRTLDVGVAAVPVLMLAMRKGEPG